MKKINVRFVFIFFVLILLILSGVVLYRNYCVDEYFVIKPLPANIPIKIRVDSYGDGHFGARRGSYKHRGIDILADIGTLVLACKSGRVIEVSYDDLSGHYIILKHKDGLTSYYLHLKDVYVKEKKRVRQGEVIATVGKSGNARYKGVKPHLHFEIRKDNIAQDVLNIYQLKPFDR